MGPISIKRPIDAPRERVFDFLCDLANRPSFTDHFISEYRLERLESVGVGAAARMRVARRHVWMDTAIVEATSPRRILERGASGRLDRVPTTTGWELVEAPAASGCEVTLSFWTEPASHLDRLREKMGSERYYRRQWGTALGRLKELIESGRPPERVMVAGGDRVRVT